MKAITPKERLQLLRQRKLDWIVIVVFAAAIFVGRGESGWRFWVWPAMLLFRICFLIIDEIRLRQIPEPNSTQT